MSESEEKIVKKRGRPKKTTEQMIAESVVKEIVSPRAQHRRHPPGPGGTSAPDQGQPYPIL